MSLPLVSCICPTYNRPPDHQHLIEEAIESFLKQDYPNKELIILNDTLGQELYCDAKGVKIVNVPLRFRTLGEKRNAGVALSQGEILAPWDDDDISLPWRLSFSVEMLGSADYYNPRRYWAWWQGRLLPEHSFGVANNASVFTRSAFERARGYQLVSVIEDRELDKDLLQLGNVVDHAKGDLGPLPRHKWFYMTRYGESPCHVSLVGDGQDPESQYRTCGERSIVEGCFYLNPHWRRDHVKEANLVLDNLGEHAAGT